MKRVIGKFQLFRSFLRLLFLQGLLNRRGMQNLGLVSALSPATGKLDDSRDSSMLLKHLSFFNCNPNFTPFVVGGVLKLEEEKRAGKPISDDDIEYFKRALTGPLAAMGDMLFIGNLKPLALTFACIFAIYKLPLGLLAVFLLYNIVIISCRLWGVYLGYTKGWELVDFFSGPEFQKVLSVVEAASAGVGGVLLGILFCRFPQNGHTMLVLAGALTAVTLYLLKRDVPASWVAIILFPTSAFVALLVGQG
ncbi:MAG: PTS mannose/fructose/sorbose transporter family subunit IID [Candidatus Latescibacterota bacterium]|nr:MAG: PTS mannose/fructose/sorbose transporter family subunit IID [Candidatus Latescibacterota bacterium]